MVWEANYGGSSSDAFYDIAESIDGGYIAVGETWSEDIIGINKDDSRDGILVKYNSNGEVEWHKNYGGEDSDVLGGVTVNENEYLATGWVEDTQSDAVVLRFTDFENNANVIVNDNEDNNDKPISNEIKNKDGLTTMDVIVLAIGATIIIIAIIVAIVVIRKILKKY